MTAVAPPAETNVSTWPPAEGASSDFVDCYRHHYRRLVGALRLAGADPPTAEDLAQEAFARTLVHWRRVRRGANPPGYVYRTGFRLLTRSRTAPSGQSTPSGEGELPAGATVGPEGEATTRVAIERALAAMPPRRRQCAVLCLVVGLPVPDAATALEIAAGTVRKHLEEARSDLRAACDPSSG